MMTMYWYVLGCECYDALWTKGVAMRLRVVCRLSRATSLTHFFLMGDNWYVRHGCMFDLVLNSLTGYHGILDYTYQPKVTGSTYLDDSLGFQYGVIFS